MTRRIKRHRCFELVLDVRDDQFIRPPRKSQRDWLLNRAVDELTDNLMALDAAARRFVPGADGSEIIDRSQADLSDQQIMEDWQIPLMHSMADQVTRSHGDVLEIGFGRGIGATCIQDRKARSHTIIECNDTIVERFKAWRLDYADRDITLVHGLWQEVLADLGEFDGIFFHTYPLDEAEMIDLIGASTTFAEHFFPHAARHLRPGGVFSYLSFEIDSLSREHQRRLLDHFSSITIGALPLSLPDDVRDAWWADSMVTVSAVR